MSEVNIGALRAVAAKLDGLGLNYAFVGGAIVTLLTDDPALSPARPTDDLDVILEVLAAERYSAVEARLRALGFDHDMRPGAPRCRWLLDALTVDIMPVDGAFLGLNTAWFAEALATATVHEIAHTRLKLISPPAFLATKYTAFIDRGRGAYLGSHDLEDLVAVVDGRANIAAEIDATLPPLRGYVIAAARELSGSARFQESLPGHLSPDRASQLRLPSLRAKFQAIAALA